MDDVHERSHRQYPHDMVLAAVWEQGYLTALADLRAKVEGLSLAAAILADETGKALASTALPDTVSRSAVLALIEEADRG